MLLYVFRKIGLSDYNAVTLMKQIYTNIYRQLTHREIPDNIPIFSNWSQKGFKMKQTHKQIVVHSIISVLVFLSTAA